MTSIVELVRWVVSPLTRTQAFRWLGPRLLPPAELLIKGLSGGRIQVSGLLVHSLTLYTTGAKSGETRASELMYTPDGNGNAIVAGTSFARERHPGWTYNLLAHPDAMITVRDRRLAVRAKPIPETHRDAAWRLIEAQWPGYRAYERESGRTVKLFLLQPIAELPSEDSPSVAQADFTPS